MPKPKTLKRPWLIQRCIVKDNKITYEYMGSSEFEFGDQAIALKEMFAEGLIFATLHVNVGNKKIPVHMLAVNGFPFAEYESYLQNLADSALHLQEWTCFDDVVKTLVGLPLPFRKMAPLTNAWFDFPNHVIWTLSEDTHQMIVKVLEEIKEKWSKKK